MSAFIQPDGSINPIFCTYLVENNQGQLLTRAETMSQRKKRKLISLCQSTDRCTEHCTDLVCALQTHAYGYQRGPGGCLSGLQPPSECMPC